MMRNLANKRGLKPNQLQVVLVEWLDHCGGGDKWLTPEDLYRRHRIHLEDYVITEVGLLIFEDEKYIVLTPRATNEGQTGEFMKIMKNCIKSRRVLAVVDVPHADELRGSMVQ